MGVSRDVCAGGRERRGVCGDAAVGLGPADGGAAAPCLGPVADSLVRCANADAVWQQRAVAGVAAWAVLAAGDVDVCACDGAAHCAEHVVLVEPGAVWRAVAGQARVDGGVCADGRGGGAAVAGVERVYAQYGCGGGGGLGRGVWDCGHPDYSAVEQEAFVAVGGVAPPAAAGDLLRGGEPGDRNGIEPVGERDAGGRIDNSSHIGGFVCGLALGLPLFPRMTTGRKSYRARQRETFVVAALVLSLVGYAIAKFA